MNLEELQQAITKLSPDELSRLRDWFREYGNDVDSGRSKDPKQLRETLKRLRGSLKSKGGLNVLMEEGRKESLL